MDPLTSERLLAEMRAELARAAPPAEARDAPPLETASYTDPARHALELERVFRRAWLQVARTDELARTGDYVALEVAGSPLVVLRTAAGELCALHNVCRHRGAQILRAPRGNAAELVCPYHGFRYDTEGVLRALPARESFPERCAPGELRLARARLETWRGWVWVTLDDAAPPLADFLGRELADELAGWPFEDCERKARRELEAAFGWKVGVEAFLESLHVPCIHRGTANPLIDFRGTVTRAFGPHSRMATPFRSEGVYEPGGALGKASREAGVARFPGLGAAQRAANFSYLVFPATIYNLLPNHFTVFRLLPAGIGRTRFVYELFGLPGGGPHAEALFASIDEGYARLIEEDLENLPWIQRGLGDPRLATIELSWHERRIRDFRAALERALGAAR